jgi:CRP-like cAMP-binding protein
MRSAEHRLSPNAGGAAVRVRARALPCGGARRDSQPGGISQSTFGVGKLATFILGFLTWTGEDTKLELELHMGREDIADYLGLTVETVSRSFAKLKAQGVVSLPRAQTIIIRDIGRLIALAAGAFKDDDLDS